MKNTILKTIAGAAMTILIVTAFGQISASAQVKEESNQPTSENSSARRENERGLEGSWDITVTRRNCQTGEAQVSFPTMTTFAEGGTMQDYGIAMAPTGRGPSHGVWNFISGRHYTAAFRFFLFGADGSNTGKQIVRRQIELNREGNAYIATGIAQVFNTSGTLMATICTTETGTRFE